MERSLCPGLSACRTAPFLLAVRLYECVASKFSIAHLFPVQVERMEGVKLFVSTCEKKEETTV